MNNLSPPPHLIGRFSSKAPAELKNERAAWINSQLTRGVPQKHIASALKITPGQVSRLYHQSQEAPKTVALLLQRKTILSAVGLRCGSNSEILKNLTEDEFNEILRACSRKNISFIEFLTNFWKTHR